MPYAGFQSMLDNPPGFRQYWSADYCDSMPDEAVDVFVKYGSDRPSPLSHRDVPWITHPFATWDGAEATAENVEWARGFRPDIERYTNGGVYLNFIGAEGEERIKAAYGTEKYARLAEVKARFDPENVFRGNQNIQPAPA
jgi:FAD/FMN-containing dehydrogenase